MENSKRGLSPEQSRLKRLFSNKAPSAYFPQLIRIFGYQLGLLLSQLAYWDGKQRNGSGWIYKTEKDILKETGLTAANQKYAIKLGKELGVLEIEYRQVPRKRHYRVLWIKVHEIIEIEAPKHGLKLTKAFVELGDKHLTITKNTQINTLKTEAVSNSVGNILGKSYQRWFRRRD